MRITSETRFPHPVLSPYTEDYLSGEFAIEFSAYEDPATSALQLDYTIALTEDSLRNLVIEGKAAVGCFIRCFDTYFSELRLLSWPSGRSDFPPGVLLNRVTLRPVIWLTRDLDGWDPGTVHQEFDPPLDVKEATVVAIAEEVLLSVGQAKLASIESIFELRRQDAVPDGRIRIDPEGDRIGIVVSPDTFEVINVLRGQSSGQPVVMSGIYLPAVLEVLDLMRGGPAEFEGFRWYQPFLAKCDIFGVDLSSSFSLLETAQTLLENPVNSLKLLMSEGDQ